MPTQEELLLSLVQGEEGKAWASSRQGWEIPSMVPVCMWEGILCDPYDKATVVSLRLPSADLSATLPSQLGRLTSLKILDVRRNLVRGPIPQEIADMQNLEIFDVAENQIDGTIPYFRSTQLKTFHGGRNSLTGTIPINIGVTNPAMADYDVLENALTGTIPSTFRFMKDLVSLSLSSNQLSGTIPPGLGNLSFLEYLYLDNNKLVGTLPPNLARPLVTAMGESDGKNRGNPLSEIWLQENGLSGTIPAVFADLKKLVNLYLDGNKLTGTVPSDLCRPTLNDDFFASVPSTTERNYCDSVACPVGTSAADGVYPCAQCPSTGFNPYLGRTGECIDLDERSILEKFLEATVGSEWVSGTNWGKEGVEHCDYGGVSCDGNNHVVSIVLRSRGLKGTIPDELGFLRYLQTLDLADNDLSGYLPGDLRWPPLVSLDVSGNRLRGIVPPLLCLKPGVNGNGEGGTSTCERIACPAGTFSSTGMEGLGGQPCEPCADDVAFLGSKTCASPGIKPSQLVPFGDGTGSSHEGGGISVSGIVGVTVSICVLVVAIAFFAALRVSRRKRRQGEILDQTESMLRPNPHGVSSLPYSSEETDGTSSGNGMGDTGVKLSPFTGSSYRDGGNMPPPSDPLYVGTFPEDDGAESVASHGSRSLASHGSHYSTNSKRIVVGDVRSLGSGGGTKQAESSRSVGSGSGSQRGHRRGESSRSDARSLGSGGGNKRAESSRSVGSGSGTQRGHRRGESSRSVSSKNSASSGSQFQSAVSSAIPGAIGDNDRSTRSLEKKEELNTAVKRQQVGGASTAVWEYPDPGLEGPPPAASTDDKKGNKVTGADWSSGQESNKEVWLDVPKV